jgi:hypothetical protein
MKTLRILILGASLTLAGSLIPAKANLKAELIDKNENNIGYLTNVSQKSYKKIFDSIKSLNDKKLSGIEKNIDSVYKKLDVPEYIDERFIKSIIGVESYCDPDRVGRAGEIGLMQISYGAWNQVEKKADFYKEAFISRKNIEVGIKYLLWLDNFCKKKHPRWEELTDKQKRTLIVTAYNAGPYKLKEVDWNLKEIPPLTKWHITKINLYSTLLRK